MLKQALADFKEQMEHLTGTSPHPVVAEYVHSHLLGTDPTVNVQIAAELKVWFQGSDELKEMVRIYLRAKPGEVPADIQGNLVAMRAGRTFCKNLSAVFCSAFMRTRSTPIDEPPSCYVKLLEDNVEQELEDNLVGALAYYCKSVDTLKKSLGSIATKAETDVTKFRTAPPGADAAKKSKTLHKYGSYEEWLAKGCKCSRCNQVGHKMKDCPKKKAKPIPKALKNGAKAPPKAAPKAAKKADSDSD